MKTFGTINPKDYTVQQFYASSPMSWELVSSSNGIGITAPLGLVGAVTIERATNDEALFYQYDGTAPINGDSGTYEYVLRQSLNHLFYEHNVFYSGSTLTSASAAGLPSSSYVVSIGQQFYGDRVSPGSFELAINSITPIVQDDGYGNLFISASGVGYYVGNIFYNQGIAVVAMSASAAATVGQNGIKIVNGSQVYVDYSSDVKIIRHEINVKLDPPDFNLSLYNPSMRSAFTTTGSVTQSFVDKNIPTSGSNTWTLYNLMHSEVMKPYITTIGLYNERYELLAVAKVSTAIQRTFDMEQIFIVRFDT